MRFNKDTQDIQDGVTAAVFPWSDGIRRAIRGKVAVGYWRLAVRDASLDGSLDRLGMTVLSAIGENTYFWVFFGILLKGS